MIIGSSIPNPEELQLELSRRLRELRVRRNFTQNELAAKAGVGPRAIADLENGAKTTVRTLVRALHALDSAEGFDAVAPHSTVSPIDVLRGHAERKRVRRRKGEMPDF